jgi:hypothetical protein
MIEGGEGGASLKGEEETRPPTEFLVGLVPPRAACGRPPGAQRPPFTPLSAAPP